MTENVAPGTGLAPHPAMLTPASRGSLPSLLLGAAGGAIVGARPRGRSARALATIAGLVLVGVAAHRPVADAVRRAGRNRRSASLRLSFVVPHDVPVVFRFCSDFENFPRFIGALREVHDYGDGRSHWCSSTVRGATVEWDAVTTKYVINRVIAWRSTAGAPIHTCGTIRFAPEAGGGTCVTVSLEYTVLNVTLADAVAALALPPRVDDLAQDITRLSEHLDLLASGGRLRLASGDPTPP